MTVASMEGGPSSRTELVWADTDRGHLMDCLVERTARRKISGGGLDDEISPYLDHAARLFAGLVNLGHTPAIRHIAEREGWVLRRQTRTSADGGEYVVRTVDRRGSRAPQLPAVAPSVDFSVSVHEAVLNAMTVPDLLGQGKLHTLHSLRNLVARGST